MTGIIIGRFQVPYLHPGHLNLIATALRECENVHIILGIQRVVDGKNPYTTGDRVRMIKKIFPQVSISVFLDKESDQEWVDDLDTYCGLIVDPVLYHSRDSFKDIYVKYSSKYPLREVEEVTGYSGSELRKTLHDEQGN